ncbi:MAG: tetratricopeptide repeat protein [Acidobacteria bacterium]|nr:tetratricopeptide repeat protein [Acidobacteriota bacterium]
MRKFLIALLSVCVAVPLIAGTRSSAPAAPLVTRSLGLYIQARLAEARGAYRQALDLYARALKVDPDSGEIRTGYASLLANVGLASQALDILKPVRDLDWYGQKIRALSLAAAAATDPEKLGKAEKALREVLAQRTGDPNVQMALIQVLRREGKIAEAESVLHDLRVRRPSNSQLLLMDATMLESLGRLDEAETLFEKCVASGPPEADCRDQLVDLLVKQGRSAKAAGVLAGGLTPDDLDGMMRAATLYAQGGKPRKALAMVNRVLQQAPSSPAARRLKALLLSDMGRYDEAASLLRELYRKNKNDAQLGLDLAWAEARQGHVPAARKLVTRLWKHLKKNPSSDQAVQICLTAARIELIAGRTAAAREWLDRITDPSAAGSRLVQLLAQTYRRDHDWRGGIGGMLRLQPKVKGAARNAAVAFEAEFRLRLGQPGARRLLAPLLQSNNIRNVRLAVHVLAAVKRWEDVAREAKTALRRFPWDHDLMFSRAAALERLGRLDEGAKLFQEILAKDPDDALSANYLGYMWADAGKHLPEALKLISHAVELEPDNGAYLDSLGWVYFKMGKLEEAEQWLRRALQKMQPDGTVLAHLGEVLAARGKTDEARQTLEQALAMGCEKPAHVKKILDRLKTVR